MKAVQDKAVSSIGNFIRNTMVNIPLRSIAANFSTEFLKILILIDYSCNFYLFIKRIKSILIS